MFSFLRKKEKYSANINQHSVEVNSKETLLTSALKQGVPMANSCRVGGCGTCKCRLVEGKTKPLTDFGYVLSEQELEQNYILACQSVPLSDVVIEANVGAAETTIEEHQGRVIAQEKLTHDITKVSVRMDTSFTYKSGQYAEISLQSLPNVFRNYSFACQPSTDGLLDFFVRKVDGGLFSEAVNNNDIVGQRLELRGPFGEFWLRPDSAPIIMVAGGSGLAPIMSILEEGLTDNIQRDVVLLFGARRQHDLYLIDEINHIAKQWSANFTFIPVLSETGDDAWTGERGLVTEHILPHLPDNAHAYLCGPPPMVDAATETLTNGGVSAEHIHADKFLVTPTSIAI